MKFLSKNLNDTAKRAKDFLKTLEPKSNQATVIGLFGDLGSGKTTFTQALGRELGITEFITSPTYVIEKVYKLDDKNNFDNLIHVDAYRLEKAHELEVLGFKELLKDKNNLIVIEWPERISEILPTDLIKINFKFVSDTEREIEY